MARQKPKNEDSNNQQEIFDDDTCAHQFDSKDEVSYSSHNSAECSTFDNADEYYMNGQQSLEFGDYDNAIDYFEKAVKFKTKELENEGFPKKDDLNPKLGKFWFAYGDTLFQKLEQEEDLFAHKNLETNDLQDTKELIWNILETARICYEKELNEHIDNKSLKPVNNILALSDWIEQNSDIKTWKFPFTEMENQDFLTGLQGLCKILTRIGDFQMAFHEYEAAIKDYEQATINAIKYNMPSPICLENAIPLAQCHICLNNMQSVLYYNFVINLCKYEIENRDISLSRKELLLSTIDDFEKQIEDFNKVKNEIKAKINEVVAHINGTEISKIKSNDDFHSEKVEEVENLGCFPKNKKAKIQNDDDNDDENSFVDCRKQ